MIKKSYTARKRQHRVPTSTSKYCHAYKRVLALMTNSAFPSDCIALLFVKNVLRDCNNDAPPLSIAGFQAFKTYAMRWTHAKNRMFNGDVPMRVHGKIKMMQKVIRWMEAGYSQLETIEAACADDIGYYKVSVNNLKENFTRQASGVLPFLSTRETVTLYATWLEHGVALLELEAEALEFATIQHDEDFLANLLNELYAVKVASKRIDELIAQVEAKVNCPDKELFTLENKFNRMPLRDVWVYFSVLYLTNNADKTEKYLTREEYARFVRRAFCGDLNVAPVRVKIGNTKGDVGHLHKLFHDYYKLCTKDYAYESTKRCARKYAALLTHLGFEPDTAYNNFTDTPKKAKAWKRTS